MTTTNRPILPGNSTLIDVKRVLKDSCICLCLNIARSYDGSYYIDNKVLISEFASYLNVPPPLSLDVVEFDLLSQIEQCCYFIINAECIRELCNIYTNKLTQNDIVVDFSTLLNSFRERTEIKEFACVIRLLACSMYKLADENPLESYEGLAQQYKTTFERAKLILAITSYLKGLMLVRYSLVMSVS